MPFPATTPPVKMQCRSVRRRSGIALLKIILPLKMRRATRSAFKSVPRPRGSVVEGVKVHLTVEPLLQLVKAFAVLRQQPHTFGHHSLNGHIVGL